MSKSGPFKLALIIGQNLNPLAVSYRTRKLSDTKSERLVSLQRPLDPNAKKEKGRVPTFSIYRIIPSPDHLVQPLKQRTELILTFWPILDHFDSNYRFEKKSYFTWYSINDAERLISPVK